ncbi:unnamed protein product [Dovyalis caffra]|uniref:Uncharacterized protein n=1 Tax=Dovyalis caffra TaxID=77055 RepID=A0AAV1S9F2_9ROSI|nr:unnamed protein product [Dovyalis caffra]
MPAAVTQVAVCFDAPISHEGRLSFHPYTYTAQGYTIARYHRRKKQKKERKPYKATAQQKYEFNRISAAKLVFLYSTLTNISPVAVHLYPTGHANSA